MKFGSFHIINILFVLSNVVFNRGVHISNQQYSNQWSFPRRVPLYDLFTEEPPFLIPSQNRIVYAFNSQPINLWDTTSQKVIFQRKWNIDTGWSNPIDIYLDPNGNDVELLGVHLDQSDVVHIIFQGNGNLLYYSQAVLTDSPKATAWLDPIPIAEHLLPIRKGISYTASITGNSSGKLVVVFSGTQNGNGLYYVHSDNYGVDWSSVSSIYLTDSDDYVVTDPELIIGTPNKVYAVWSTFDNLGFGGPGYFSSLDLNQMIWSELKPLDASGIRTPSIIEYNNEIIVSYYHHNVNSNWWRISPDSGKTWSNPKRISQSHVGTNGGVSLVVDSDNRLSAFFGERINDDSHGVWELNWTGGGWTPPEPVVIGPQIKDIIGGNGFDPRSVRAAVVNGNILLLTWGTDGAAGENGAWYSYRVLNSTSLPVVEPRSLSPRTTPTPESVPELNNLIPSEPNANSSFGAINLAKYDQRSTPQIALFVAFISTVTVCLFYITYRILKNTR